MKLGDAVAKVTIPMAEAIDIVFGTDLQSCSSCKNRQQKLNNLGDAIYDVFWEPKEKQE